MLGLLSIGATQAATVLVFTDKNPGKGGDATFGITGGASITDPAPGINQAPFSQMVHTVTTVDGGTFDVTIDATQTGGTGSRLNGFGNWSVSGGANDIHIDPGETMTLTVSVGNYGGGLTAGDVQLDGFTTLRLGGHGNGEDGTIQHGGADISMTNNDNYNVTGNAITVVSEGTYNIQGYDIQFTVEAVPEPSSTALLGLGGLALILRRRK